MRRAMIMDAASWLNGALAGYFRAVVRIINLGPELRVRGGEVVASWLADVNRYH